jgi:hypothetical protein
MLIVMLEDKSEIEVPLALLKSDQIVLDLLVIVDLE